MSANRSKSAKSKDVEAFVHEEAKRRNIPTAEFESIMEEEDKSPVRLAYERRNRDLDPQLVWRGKDEQDWSDLVVQAPPLYIQEKVHPKVLIDDLVRQSKARAEAKQDAEPAMFDLFADFNGLPDAEAKTEFYEHDHNWSNRMILGDSLQVMASLAEREGLRGKVQCIYIDPPYGIKFNSNFQWSTTSRDVKDGKPDHITREPEQVKAFRDTWRDGIHSYLTYLRDRLTVARDLLADSGSVFVQIGDENVHRVRALMDEVFGEQNHVVDIIFKKKSSTSTTDPVNDYIIWCSKNRDSLKVRKLFIPRKDPGSGSKMTALVWRHGRVLQRSNYKDYEIDTLLSEGAEWARVDYPVVSQHPSKTRSREFLFEGIGRTCGVNKQWRFGVEDQMPRLAKAQRLFSGAGSAVGGIMYWADWNQESFSNIWEDIHSENFPIYVVQTSVRAIERCILMTTDPGDLVLDPTCGSGTTAYVAEQWGRRWITIDTSRVALALARARIMGARYPYYLLADSPAGKAKEEELRHGAAASGRRGRPEADPPGAYGAAASRRRDRPEADPPGAYGAAASRRRDRPEADPPGGCGVAASGRRGRPEADPPGGYGAAASRRRDRPEADPPGGYRVRLGFVYERVPHITLKSIANNAEIDVIWERFQAALEPLRAQLNAALGKDWEEWEIPREAGADWPEAAKKAHAQWWEQRIARQKEIDASIAARADHEYLYDKPYADTSCIRVAGPFTVESLSPHRVLAVDQDDELFDVLDAADGKRRGGDRTAEATDFTSVVLENLKTAGVQQAHKEDKITFTAIAGWPGAFICAEGRYMEGDTEKRAGIFIGPEFGTVARPDLVAAAREAGDAGFDSLIACAFNYDAHAGEFDKLGRIPVLKARMNADLHMADELKNTGKGNLFVIFGEPDIEISEAGEDRITVRINGVDVFHPQTGEITASGPEGIACWFIDTDYNEESFFVRHAYFLGANDPYKALKSTLKAEIDEDAWSTLNSDTSRPFDKPSTGRIAVKVINHLGDEVMKVFSVR
jgi:adenine-specific DNA-methyltransferase